jgi:hypothetical protein
MKKIYLLLSTSILCLIALGFIYPPEKLMEPLELVKIMKSSDAAKTIIFNVGPNPQLKGATYIGPGEDPTNKERMKTLLKGIAKNQPIVIYCGCCKLEDCWNIAEASKILAAQNYTNYKILNLSEDFTEDWVNKGYPLEQ